MDYTSSKNKKKGNTGRTGAILLTLTALASYGVGFGRDLLLAHIFGSGIETDIFFAGFLIPDFLFTLLFLGFLSGALLPVFTEAFLQDKKRSERILSSVINIAFFVAVIVCGIAFICTPLLIHYFFGTVSEGAFWSSADIEKIVSVTRILLLSPLLFGISNALGMALLSQKRFFWYGVSPLLYNLGIIGGIFFFGAQYGVIAGAWGAVCGASMHLLVRLLDFKSLHIRLLPRIEDSPEVRRIFVLGLPRTIGLLSFQGVLLVFGIFAGQTIEGGISAWNFARNIQSLPISLFGISFATAAFPFLSESVSCGKKKIFLQKTMQTMTSILLFALPSAVGIFILSDTIVSVLLEHGNFSESGRILTASILLILSCSLVFESLTHLFSRMFLSHQNTYIPAGGKILFFIIAVSTAYILLPHVGISALAIGFAAASICELVFLAGAFSVRYIPLSFFRCARVGSALLLISGIMGYGVYTISHGDMLSSEYIRLAISIGVGAGIYGLGVLMIFPFLFPKEKTSVEDQAS